MSHLGWHDLLRRLTASGPVVVVMMMMMVVMSDLIAGEDSQGT
jgi:hypothetical protein